MQEALKEAKKGLTENGIPIGAILVKDDIIIGRGHNRRIQEDNPIMHAEINCISMTGRIKSYRDVVLFSTLMPCYLCAGAIIQFGIKKVVVGESDTFKGAENFLKEKGVEVINLDLKECKNLLQKYIKEHKEIWYEDIGLL